MARQIEAAHRTSLAKDEVGIREKKVVPTLAAFMENRTSLGQVVAARGYGYGIAPGCDSGRKLRRVKRLYGERGWTRTIDPCLKRALLCQLSYAPTFLSI